MSHSINIFVPIYNEADSERKLELNIRRARKVFPDVKFFFSDNASDDGTGEMLLRLQAQYPDNVQVSRQPENIGFQRNLSAIANLPSDRMILILGANDQIYTPGIRRLRHALTEMEHDLVVCSCYYVSGSSKLRLLYNADKDIRPFTATSLDEFIRKGGIIPNGIMQYMIHPRHKHLFASHIGMLSPQIGVFFDIFPGRVRYISFPPIALVNKTETRGWRSTVEGILETHMFLARDVIALAECAFNSGGISLSTYLRIRFIYTHVLVYLMFKELVQKEFWGSWSLRGRKKTGYVLRFCRDILRLSPRRWMNPFMILTISLHVVVFRIQWFFAPEPEKKRYRT